jgi:hypothetical protein
MKKKRRLCAGAALWAGQQAGWQLKLGQLRLAQLKIGLKRC